MTTQKSPYQQTRRAGAGQLQRRRNLAFEFVINLYSGRHVRLVSRTLRLDT
jgi:hypothetical protein